MIRLIVLLTLSLAAVAHAQEAKPVVLFDGTSTAGWKQAGPGSFELVDGALVTKGGMGLFWHERAFKDFVLTLEYQVGKPGDNSGVFVRFPNPGNDPWVAVHKGHEIQICDTEKGKQTGAIYNFKNSAKLASKPPGEWNRYEIRVVGQQYTVTLNGERVNEYTASRADRGHIGLQNHDGGAVVRFRNIQVTELNRGDNDDDDNDDRKPATQATTQPLVPVSIKNPTPGVVAEYFRGVKKWSDVAAALKNDKPFLVRTETDLDLDGGDGQFRGTKLSDHFAARYTGFLRVATPGRYKFVVRSDDGATFRLGQHFVIDNATENKPMRDNRAEVELAAGDYPFVVEFHQMAGGAGFVLSWVVPGATENRRSGVPVPASALFREKDALDRIAWDKAAWDAYTWDKKAWARAYGPRYVKMDYGRFLAHTIEAGKDNTVPKGVAIKLDTDGDTAIVYDTDLLRVAAAWTGGFLREQGVAFNGAHGPSPRIEGDAHFSTKPGPGWANSAGEFKDPRAEPFGPLPREWAKFKGVYRAGDQTVVAYTVGGADVLELPSAQAHDGRTVFTRTFKVGPSRDPMTLLVAETSDVAGGGVGFNGSDVGPSKKGSAGELAVLWVAPGENKQKEIATAAGVSAAPRGAEWEIVGGRLHLHLPPREQPVTFALNVWSGAKDDLKHVDNALRAKVEMVDIAGLTKGGHARWTKEVVTTGELGAGDGPYVVDTITVPEDNPWDAWMRIGGLDFFADGRAAVCTWSGDVWIVSGLDERLEKVTWKRYATGLFQPLGLRIVDDTVYTLGRDQITRLHDLNNDGEADFYENFNNDCTVSSSFHEFAMDLQTDPEGNFYYAKAGPVRPGGRGWQTITAHAGTVLKVSKDGRKLDVFATGVRAPNGMGASPTGEISIGDNEGTWTPACRLSIVHPGDFLGVVDLSKRPAPPTEYDKPLCWFPHAEVDNSSGCQVWVTSDAWGPFAGDMLHLSYGKAALYKVLAEQVDGMWQGGVVRFPLTFNTGICRARFHPVDHQLYVAGLRGWQTDGAKDAGLQRVRYTGGRVDMPKDLRVTDEGITITFTSPMDRTAAADVENYAVEQWNYVWSKEYGSPHVSVADPNVKGHDPVEVDAAVVSADARSVLLKIADLEPVMQMKIEYKIKTDDGRPLEQAIYNTINKVGKADRTAKANGAAAQ